MAHLRTFVESLFTEKIGLDPLAAKDLEIGVFNATLDYAGLQRIAQSWCSDAFQEVYLARARSVFANLCPDSHVGNQDLRKRMEEHEFLPHEIPFITRESLFPSLWKPILDKEQLRSKEAYEFRQAAMTDHIKCTTCLKKGWKSKITYYELQTRSADEPMTLMIKCHTCGHRWKN